LFTFTVAQIDSALAQPYPELPTAASMPAGTLAALKSSDRKLTNHEVKARNQVLVGFFTQSYPGMLSKIQAWAGPAYEQTLSNLGIGDVEHFRAHEQGSHRALLLGVSMITVLTESTDDLELKVNQFSLLDPAELRFWTGYASSDTLSSANNDRRRLRLTNDETRRILQSLPTSYDMRTTISSFPPIRNQMQCGSCWAFTTSSTLEIQAMTLNGLPPSGELSEQELVSCDTNDSGCNGGDPATAASWIKSNGGLATDAAYPYVQYITGNEPTPACSSAEKKTSVLTVTGTTVYLPTGTSGSAMASSEAAIMQAIVTGHPVTLSIAASSNCFNNYAGGILTCTCGGEVDHVVLAIGWTSTYWIVRNQWGTSWGDNGYAYFPRGKDQCKMISAGPEYVSAVAGTSATPSPSKATSTSNPTTTVAPTTTPKPSTATTSTAKPTSTTTSTAKPTSTTTSTAKPTSTTTSTAKPTSKSTTAKPTTKATTTARPTTTAKPTTTRKPTKQPTRYPTQEYEY